MQSLLGIDIGSRSIKLIEIGEEKGVRTLMAAGSMPTPPKSTTSVNSDIDASSYIIKQLVRDTGAKSDQVNIALPEAQVFTRIIEVPQLSTKELNSAIQWEAEQYIPLPLDQVNLDYCVTGCQNNWYWKMQVLLVYTKALIERYMTIIELSDLTPVAAKRDYRIRTSNLGICR